MEATQALGSYTSAWDKKKQFPLGTPFCTTDTCTYKAYLCIQILQYYSSSVNNEQFVDFQYSKSVSVSNQYNHIQVTVGYKKELQQSDTWCKGINTLLPLPQWVHITAIKVNTQLTYLLQ